MFMQRFCGQNTRMNNSISPIGLCRFYFLFCACVVYHPTVRTFEWCKMYSTIRDLVSNKHSTNIYSNANSKAKEAHFRNFIKFANVRHKKHCAYFIIRLGKAFGIMYDSQFRTVRMVHVQVHEKTDKMSFYEFNYIQSILNQTIRHTSFCRYIK